MRCGAVRCGVVFVWCGRGDLSLFFVTALLRVIISCVPEATSHYAATSMNNPLANMHHKPVVFILSILDCKLGKSLFQRNVGSSPFAFRPHAVRRMLLL